MKKETLDKITEIITPILESKGYELVDIEYTPSPEGMILRVYIDKDGGVKIRDCEIVSVALSAILNSNEIIEEDYTIEVSSPGIYRELKREKDFIKYLGHRVKVKLYSSVEIPNYEKQKVFFGKIKDFKNNTLWIILDNNTEIAFDMKDVAKVNLEPDISSLFNK